MHTSPYVGNNFVEIVACASATVSTKFYTSTTTTGIKVGGDDASTLTACRSPSFLALELDR